MKAQLKKRNITPKESCYLCGHAIRTELSKGVLDPLYSTVLLLKDDEKLNCFISLDLILIDLELTNMIKHSIHNSLCIDINNIIVSVTHTHAAPEVTEISVFNNPEKGVRPGYRDYILNQTLQAAIEANNELEDVHLYYTSTLIDGYYSNRNDKNLVCDKSANILKIERVDQSILGLMVNMSCHCTVLGPQNYYISADLFGAVRTGLSNHYQCEVLMIQGASGDMGNRQYRQGNDQKELFRMRDGILPQLIKDFEYNKIDCNEIIYRKTNYIMDYDLDLSELKVRLEAFKLDLNKETDFDQIKLLSSGIRGLENVIKEGTHVHLEFTGTIIRLDKLIYVCVPCELFNQLGATIKKSFKEYDIVIWGYCDYSNGYLVENKEYGKHYESIATQIKQGMPEKYVEYLKEEIGNVL